MGKDCLYLNITISVGWGRCIKVGEERRVIGDLATPQACLCLLGIIPKLAPESCQ